MIEFVNIVGRDVLVKQMRLVEFILVDPSQGSFIITLLQSEIELLLEVSAKDFFIEFFYLFIRKFEKCYIVGMQMCR
jgi:hypothetical protein